MRSLFLCGLGCFAISISIPAAAQIQKSPEPAGLTYEPQNADERSLWLAMNEQEQDTKNSKFLIKDPALNSYIKSVLCKTVGNDRCSMARIYIMRAPQFNASMAPNGMMVVWSGLLLRTRNEAELAVVLGHEFGHFEKQHSLQSLIDIRAKTNAMKLLSLVPYVGFAGQIGLVGSIFTFSRDMERQADLAGLDYMVRSGYDTMAASAIWEQLRAEMDATATERNLKSKKDDNGGFFATHPNSGERMEYLRDAALKLNATGKKRNTLEYKTALAKWWPMLIDDQIKLNDFGATEFLLKRTGSEGLEPEILYARGELYRARGLKDDFVKAAAFYRQAINSGAAMPETWRGFGIALIRSGNPAAGRKALLMYLSKQPEAADRALITMMARGK